MSQLGTGLLPPSKGEVLFKGDPFPHDYRNRTRDQLRQSLAAINKACSAFLNGQDTTPHVDKFLRRQLELDVYEELEIWGKFSPPPQIIEESDER